MTTTVIVPVINREVTEDLFADLTDSEWRSDSNHVNEIILTFADDLPEDLPKKISDRCRLFPVEEELIATLQNVNGKKGNLFDADLKAAVMALTRLYLKDFATD